MKILYIADERAAAAAAAHALRGIAPNVTLTWAATLGSALQWVESNRDAAVIVESEVHGEDCTAFVARVRNLGLTTPIVVVAPEHLGAQAAALEAGADACVAGGLSMQTDLPRVLTAALQRMHAEAATRQDADGPQGDGDRVAVQRDALDARLAEALAARQTAEQRLARAEEARQEAEQRWTCEVAAAAARLADGQAQHSAALAREARICTALQLRLLELEGALRNADERRAAEAAASADQLAKRHAEFTGSLAQAAQLRDTLTQKLGAAMSALDEARKTSAAASAAAAEHLARREAELAAALAEAVAARTALEHNLAAAEAEHRNARQRAAADLAAAADRQTELEERLARETVARGTLEEELTAAAAARRDAEERHAAELEAAAKRLADLQAQHEAATEGHAAARAVLEQEIGEAKAALEGARQRWASEAAAAAAHLARRDAELRAAAERQASLEDRLAQETDTRRTLEQKLAAADAARQDADERRHAELSAAAQRLAEVQAQYDAALTESAAARAAFERQLREAEAALDNARREWAAETAARQRAVVDLALAAGREAALDGRLADEATARGTVERQLADEAAARVTVERQLSDEATARATAERELAGTRTESARTRQRLLHLASAHRRRAREHRESLEAQLARERAESVRNLEAKDDEIQQNQLAREALRQALAATQEQLQRLQGTLDDERQAYEQSRLASQSELERVSAEYDQLRRSLNQLQSAFHTLEGIAGEHAIERARLEGVVADRDAELGVQAERHQAAEQATQRALADAQEKLRLALDTGRAETARLQGEIRALQEELSDARARVRTLRNEADQIPVLQIQLEESRRERRRQFERAAYGVCHCRPDGAIADANHSLARLLGYRRGDDLRKIDFAADVFEDAGDLRWLLERSASTGKTDPVEVTWKTKDRRRLVVRLQALTTTTGSVEIVVEDITNLRALEQRLRQAHRMEAVGRLASEVAVTCGTLLRDVTEGGGQWLAAIGDDALRRQGELLLGDITRAASLLRQLAVYGNRQAGAQEPVSVQRILRDLEPVLKRVAGDDIELVLPRSSTPADVDVEAERVERILVNVASYARQRMPQGGHVQIDLATTTLGRRFIARYPNVRPGGHVVITVTEARRTVPSELPAALHDEHGGAAAAPSASDNPRVDLGVLLELVGHCGGHLWMEAEPAGNMTLKIHLPRRAADDLAEPPGPTGTTERGRQLARWFRTTSPAATAGT